jgi:GT2 family glycosyltransferase
MALPRVSVVLPVWNGARFLATAIESVLAQTFESLELIIVDDGSDDATREIAMDFARRDTRVTVLLLDSHRGIARALNTGIAVARGHYVARMDADDVAVPTRLETQLAYLDAHPECVAVGSAVEVIDEDGNQIGTASFPERHADIAHALLAGRGASLAHPAVVMRKDAIHAAGGYHGESFPSEDLDLWLRLSEVGALANVGQTLLRYRRHRNAVSVRERGRQATTTERIIAAARRRKGLPPLARRERAAVSSSEAATYHLDCARIALVAGKRLAALRHVRAGIVSAPLWPTAYAVLVACALPTRTLLMLYARLRASRA